MLAFLWSAISSVNTEVKRIEVENEEKRKFPCKLCPKDLNKATFRDMLDQCIQIYWSINSKNVMTNSHVLIN